MSPTTPDAGCSGAQLWMGSVPKRLDSDQISRAFIALGAPAPIAVVLRRSTYRVDGVDDPVGFALVDFASAKDAATALTLCEGASFQVPDASTTTTSSGECVFHLRRAAETLRKKVDAYRQLDSMSGRDDASSDDVGGGGGVGLAAQLAPLEPETIRARLASMNIAVSPEDEMKWKGEFIFYFRMGNSNDIVFCLLQTRAATVCGDCGWWRGSARRTANPSTIHPGVEPRTVRSRT